MRLAEHDIIRADLARGHRLVAGRQRARADDTLRLQTLDRLLESLVRA